MIAILGSIPPRIHLNLSFISDVILLETDITPAADADYLRSIMMIGAEVPVRLYRLLVASSFEMEFVMESSAMIEEFHNFVGGTVNRFSSFLLYGWNEYGVLYIEVIWVLIIQTTTWNI